MKKSKIISLCIILFLYSCSVNKIKKSNYNIEFAVQDYLKTFLIYNRIKPHAIYINVDKSLISIKDLSENISMGYIDEIKQNGNLKVGKIHNTICFYLDEEINGSDDIFKKIKIKNNEVQVDTVKLNGKDLIIPYNSSMEWEPTLEIRYDLVLKMKRVNYYIGNETKELPW